MTIKEYVKARKEEIKAEVAAMPVKPNLVIVQLNEDEASKAYVHRPRTTTHQTTRQTSACTTAPACS